MFPKFLIYGLIDPRNGQLRYVGKSCSGLNRPKEHSYPAVLRRERTHKANWIRQLQSLGLNYEIEILEVHDSKSTLQEAEVFWISYYKFIGCSLTNGTSGGDGGGGQTWTPEHRAKQSEITKRQMANPAARAKISQSIKDQWTKPEYRDWRVEASKERLRSSEAKQKLFAARWAGDARQRQSEATKAQMSNPEARLNISRNRRGKRASLETIARLSESHKGLVPSDESRARRSASMKEVWKQRKAGN